MPDSSFDRKAYRRWVLVNALGYAICLGLVGLFMFGRHVVLADFPTTFSNETQAGKVIASLDLPIFLLGTLLVGWLQWYVLKRIVGVSAWWVPATAVGLGIGLWGVQLGFLSMGMNEDLIFAGMSLCSLGLVIGGIPQWLTVRSKISRSWLWMVFSPLALLASYVAIWYISMRMLGVFFYGSSDPGAEVLARLGDVLSRNGLSWGKHIPWLDVPIELLVGGIVGGLVYGLITGQVLIKLLRRPTIDAHLPEEPDMPVAG